MSHSRRAVLTTAGTAGICSLALGVSAATPDDKTINHAVADLVQRSEEANAALMRGDIDTYLGLITLSDDFTLMSPFGGKPSHGPYTRERWDEIGRNFKNGTLRQEVAQSYGTADMVVLAVIEHGHGEIGGLAAQDWPLRVTLVYRRDGGEWRLVHRHADALVDNVSLEQLAALARGERP